MPQSAMPMNNRDLSGNAPEMLWQPTDAMRKDANITRFIDGVNRKYRLSISDYPSLWQWSVDRRAEFWDSVWDFCGMIGDKGAGVLESPDRIEASVWFPNARLNYAENLLRQKNSDDPAIIFWGEEKIKKTLSFAELYQKTASLHAYFRKISLSAGDRVCGFVPNMPETIIAMLAATSLGGVWSSCSPDFGVQGVLDRFGQIEPKVFVSVDGYYYKGQPVDCLGKVRDIVAKLPTVERVIIIPFVSSTPDISGIKNAVLFGDASIPVSPASEIDFVRVPFNHPLFILFSSGTTGVPKCIVHGVGGTLIQHLKEHQLQSDVKPGDRVFYYTTCGWMMWNWLVSALASSATLLLYDGFPFQRRGQIIFDFLSENRATLFGTAAKFIDAVSKLDLRPAATHDLSALRLITSTGSPLSPEGFDFIYKNVKPDICLSSISGGTDVVSCLVLGSPISPVYRGEIQVAGLGMDIAVVDDDGKKLIGEKGELACLRSFPCQPIYFWNDADREKYHAAYFAKIPNIWCHSDYAEQTPRGGFVIYGRSDTTLKPGGVRIGTAEIYRQVEILPQVVESLVIGQDWDNDVRVVLFVKLRDGIKLDDELKKTISTQIKNNASPRHVPAKIIQVPDIPRTKSGKIVELAVREIVHGRAVKNIESLANPEALAHFKGLAELSS